MINEKHRHEIADLIDRPTCRNVSGHQDVFEPRRREDFAGMMRDNQDTPRMHT